MNLIRDINISSYAWRMIGKFCNFAGQCGLNPIAMTYFFEAFRALSFNGKSPIFIHRRRKAVDERSCLSYIHSRQGGYRYSIQAWEWTVYFCDRRLAMPPLR